MLSGNSTIDYDIEAHTLDAQKTSTAHQEPTTRSLQKQAASGHNDNRYHFGISLYF